MPSTNIQINIHTPARCTLNNHIKKNNNFQNLQHLAACQIELGHIVCASAAKGRHAQNYGGAQVWVQTLGLACSPRSH